MIQFGGYIDIENDELAKYSTAVQKKIGVCRILPAGRFVFRDGQAHYGGLVCSDKMGGLQTGCGAESCKNCLANSVSAHIST